MPDQPYTTRQAWLGKHEDGTYVLLRSRRDYPKAGEISALVVTGDLATARRRLREPDDAAIERAARAIEGAIDKHGPFVAMTTIAREVLAAAEETGDA